MPIDPVHKICELIDLDAMHGIEIGALHTPRLPPDHPNVRYLDHATREELIEKYASNPEAAPQAERMVPVDYVWKPGQRLAEVVGDDAPMDFVIASHVIEHIPDPIGWLRQIGEILGDGGLLILVVPDRRFTFDINRPETTAAELVEAMLEQRQIPSAQQTFSHESGFVGTVDALAVWEGLDLSSVRRTDVDDPDRFALERARSLDGATDYVDVHCSVFTPDSFLDLFQRFVRLGLLDFGIVRFYPTEYGHYEFFVTLRSVADPTPADRERMAASAAPFFGAEAERPPADDAADADDDPPHPDELPPEPDGDDRFVMNLSRAEVNAVLAKRRAARGARSLVGRIRPR